MKLIKQNKYLVLLLAFFLVLRFINLTKLPIFNDEAIYLDWGWREITHPGYLFYSLYDSKQPLLMWIFGISEALIHDPLWAGRAVSVGAGLFSLFGLYKIGRTHFSEKVGLIAAALYIIIPIFSFFDRQALMESSVTAVGIWFVFYALRFLERQRFRHAAMTGLLLGVGLFIKTSFLVFFLTFCFMLVWDVFRNKKWSSMYIKKIGVMLAVAGLFDSLLLVQPMFWSTLGSNSRYSLTLYEVITTFPVHFFTNIFGNLQIMFFYLSPFVLILSIVGVVVWKSEKIDKQILYLAGFIFIPLLLETLIARGVQQRYVVSFFALWCIPAAYAVSEALRKKHIILMVLSAGAVIYCLGVTMTQIMHPLIYFQIGSIVTPFSQKTEYVLSQPSGFGIPETVRFLRTQAQSRPIIAAVALNTGNPESAVFTYFKNDSRVRVVYLDSKEFGSGLSQYNCFVSSLPLYFISRNDQQAGLNDKLIHVRDFKNPYGDNWIGIYTLKSCTMKAYRLD